jgi:hypothetical protein
MTGHDKRTKLLWSATLIEKITDLKASGLTWTQIGQLFNGRPAATMRGSFYSACRRLRQVRRQAMIKPGLESCYE